MQFGCYEGVSSAYPAAPKRGVLGTPAGTKCVFLFDFVVFLGVVKPSKGLGLEAYLRCPSLLKQRRAYKKISVG